MVEAKETSIISCLIDKFGRRVAVLFECRSISLEKTQREKARTCKHRPSCRVIMSNYYGVRIDIYNSNLA